MKEVEDVTFAYCDAAVCVDVDQVLSIVLEISVHDDTREPNILLDWLKELSRYRLDVERDVVHCEIP